MRKKWMRVFAVGCLGLLALATLGASGWPTAQRGAMGPRDVAEIPIESVPAWVSENVLRVVPDPAGESRVSIEVLAVVEDPRDVPIDRFLYALTDEGEVMVHPQADAIRSSLGSRGHSTVAVYVRVRARAERPDDAEYPPYIDDPFFVGDPVPGGEVVGGDEWSYEAWRSIGVAYGEDGIASLPCLEPMTIEKGTRPFTAPDTGERIRPDEYLPPQPQYVVTDNSADADLLQGEMGFDEVREGWVMCLAPDVPAEDVRLGMYWVPVDEMAIGEWYLLEERQVLAWNEEPAWSQGEKPVRVDEQVVYEGEVWVSVAQALRHMKNPRVGSDGIAVEPFEEEVRLQMYFEGMEELLQTWDQLGLKDGRKLNRLEEWSLTGYVREPGSEEIRARGTSLYIGSEQPIMSGEGYREPHEVMWLALGNLEEPEEAGPLAIWRVEFEEIDERDLTTEAVCAQTECAMLPVGPSGKEVVTAIPVVPVGTRARGLTVWSASLVQAPVLRASGLDVFVEEGRSSYITGSYHWLVAAASLEGLPRVIARNLRGVGVEEGEFPMSVEPCMDYGTSGGRVSFGNTFESYFRAGRSRVLLVSELHSDWSLTDTVLVGDGGPAWNVR